MKKLAIILGMFSSIFFIQSCGLLGDEDEFTCGKNAPLNKGGKDICAGAGIVEFTQNLNEPSEYMEITFVYGTGSFDVTLSTSEIQPNVEYSYPGEVGLWFAAINKSGSGNFTVTEIDRTNRTMSGQYDLTAEGASNFQAYEFHVVGTFTDVSF